jgi:hypothetical protein
VCARCQLPNISQDHSRCPRCDHDLGSRGVYFEADVGADGQASYKVPDPDIPPFMVFSCDFGAKLGCRIQGTGPVVVTAVLDPEMLAGLPAGRLLREHAGGACAPTADADADATATTAATAAYATTATATTATATAATAATAAAAAPVRGAVLSVSHPNRSPVAGAGAGGGAVHSPQTHAASSSSSSSSSSNSPNALAETSVLSLDIAGGLPPPRPHTRPSAYTSSPEVVALNAASAQRVLKPRSASDMLLYTTCGKDKRIEKL